MNTEPEIKHINLRRRYVSAFVLVLLCAVLFFAATSYLIKEQATYAKVINLAGKERMFCVVIQHSAHHYYYDADAPSKRKLLEAIAVFESIEKELFSLQVVFQTALKGTYLEHARSVAQSRNEKAFLYIDANAAGLLAELDNIVLSLQRESEAKVTNIQRIDSLLFVLFLLLLFLIVYYIFLPAEREIKLRARQLLEANELLEQRVTHEVEKRTQQENLLIQQSRMAEMGEMIGNIAHQWRQPLNALSLVIANIKFAYEHGRLDDAFIDKTVEKSNRLVQKMSATIEDFSNFFKPDKTRRVFRLHVVVTEVLSLLEGIFKHNNITVEEKIAEDLCTEGFRNEFSQVLLNLLNNAKDVLIDNKIEEPSIKITGYRKDERVYVCIEDNAGGIPAKVMPKVFDPYFTTKEQGKGTGIGLYMSRTIIEEHMGGRISVKNGEKGAVFTLELDVTDKVPDENIN